MKHFHAGFLFFLPLIYPKICLAAISLNISNLATKEDHYTVTAVVSGMSSSSGTFVQGMFTNADSNQYFGYTFGSKGDWLKYQSSPEKSFVLENFIELKNDQPTTIYIKPDYQDPDYLGPGRYQLKLKRYTASGSPSDYSNFLELNLSQSTPTTIVTPSPTSTYTPTNTPTKFVNAPSPTPTKSPTQTQKIPTLSSTPTTKTITTFPTSTTTRSTAVLSPASQAGQVLATTSSLVATESSTPVITNLVPELWQSSASSSILSDKNLFIIGTVIFAASGGLLYFRLKNL